VFILPSQGRTECPHPFGLGGLSYALSQLAPLFLMCDPSDLGVHTDAAGTIRGAPSIFLYDQVRQALASAKSFLRSTMS